MSLRLAVTLAGATDNPTNLPVAWPVLVEEVHDDTAAIPFPKVEMTLLEYQQHRAAYQPVYDAWELERALAAAKAEMIEKLWQATYDYNFMFFSGGAPAQILELKLAGSTRATAAGNWILALWGDYYVRKYGVSVATSLAAVEATNIDFSNHGSPPYTVPEMLEEAAQLQQS